MFWNGTFLNVLCWVVVSKEICSLHLLCCCIPMTLFPEVRYALLNVKLTFNLKKKTLTFASVLWIFLERTIDWVCRLSLQGSYRILIDCSNVKDQALQGLLMLTSYWRSSPHLHNFDSLDFSPPIFPMSFLIRGIKPRDAYSKNRRFICIFQG